MGPSSLPLLPPPPPKRTSSTSSISITPRCSTRETGLPTRSLDLMTTTAPSPSLTTGRVLNNALSPGNAEVPECAREEDGAPDSMDVRDPHFQPKLQDFPTLTEKDDRPCHWRIQVNRSMK